MSEDPVQEKIVLALKEHFSGAKIYEARNGNDTARKIYADKPNLLILDSELKRCSADEVIKKVYSDQNNQAIQTVFLNKSGDSFDFEDLITMGSLQVVTFQDNLEPFFAAIYKAVNRHSPSDGTFKIRIMRKGELLLKEGEKGDTLFILKKGLLTAFLGDSKAPSVLGQISPGEFVGEMAYINGEPRTASVKAEEDSELVEFKIETFDQIIFKRPSWMKALLRTLSKRVKILNLFRSRHKGP